MPTKPPKKRSEKEKIKAQYRTTLDTPMIAQMMRAGFTDVQICKCLNITPRALQKRKKSDPALAEIHKSWKDEFDDKVEVALAERATGVVVWEERCIGVNDAGEPKIIKLHKQLPPDPVAIIWWLKNRRPDKWRDKHEFEAGETLSGVLATLYQAALDQQVGIPRPPSKEGKDGKDE